MRSQGGNRCVSSRCQSRHTIAPLGQACAGLNVLVQGEGCPTISHIRITQDATSDELAVAATAQQACDVANGHACPTSQEEAEAPPAPSVLNPLDHPLYALVAYGLRYDTTKSSDKHPSVSAMVGASYEPLIDAAIAWLVGAM